MSKPKNQNRTFHLLQKADILTCYGQGGGEQRDEEIFDRDDSVAFWTGRHNLRAERQHGGGMVVCRISMRQVAR